MSTHTRSVDKDNPILETALTYARRGIKVFATSADGKAPATGNKAWEERLGKPVPRGRGGFHQATTDEETIRWMFAGRRVLGVGMPCGKVNDVIVADFDTYKDGEEGRNARAMFEEWRDEIGEAQIVTTQSGGTHVYFKYEEGHGKFELGQGIEVQTDGAYVLLPPSKGYKWGQKVEREDWEAPPWQKIPTSSVAKAIADDDPRYAGEVHPDLQALIEVMNAKNGGWHNAALGITASLVGSGWSDAEILRYAIQWTRGGHTHIETFEELCVMVAGAREKWTQKKAAEERNERAAAAIKRNLGKLTTKQLSDLHIKTGKMINDR